MMQLCYEMDGRISYELMNRTCREIKEISKDMMRSGKYEFVEARHLPDMNIIIYLKKRKKGAWGGYRHLSQKN